MSFKESIMRRDRRRWLHGLQRWLIAGALAGMAPLALADAEYAAAWGPSVGSTAPLLSANDQDGKLQTLATLTGSRGLLVVFNRSVDW
jgi:hypothetical protein